MAKNMKNKQAPSLDLLDRMDAFFGKHKNKFLWFGMAFAFLFSLLLFSLKMSEMGDDSGYVLRAFRFLKTGQYPTFQGPFYPMFLSLFIAVFGMKITLLKLVSMALVMGALYLFYRSLENKIPNAILLPVFLLTAINSYMLYFSGQTFSESLYLLLQSLLFLVLFRSVPEGKDDFAFRRDWKQFLLIGLILFVGYLTRSVHLGALVAVVFFFLVIGRWRSSLATVGGFGIFYLLFDGIKRIFWHMSAAQIAAQGQQMTLKNPYNAQEGLETFSGYLDRLVDNSVYYVSNAFYSIAGLREEAGDGSGLVTLLTYALVFLALILVFRRNRVLLFSTLYTGALCLVTFIGLQVFWAQWRLVAVFYPFLLLALFSAFYYGLKRYRGFQILYPFMLVVLLFAGLGDTFSKAGKNLPVLKANLAGDAFADYAPEWKNFMEMSRWSAKNVPADAQIASRKPEMSFIYSGREFYGIYSMPEANMDSLKRWSKGEEVLLGIDPMALASTPLFPQLSKEVLAFAQGTDNSLVGVYSFSSSEAAGLVPQFEAAGLKVDAYVLQTLEAKVASGVEMHVIDPEALTQLFVKNNIRYVILNSPNLFQTLHRYLTFVQLKYPQSLSVVHAIGNDQAQAQLVQFNPDQTR